MGTIKRIQVDADTEFILPSDHGDADQALTTNGSGTLSWATVTADSGGTGKNYISNPDGNTAITYWGVYADAAAAIPVDGTGGSANVTITRNTSTPLSGAGDILITKDGSNRQGQGVQTDFTIDNADKAQKMLISFDYTTSSSYVDGDISLFIYDVTNTSIIRINSEDLQAVSGTGKHYAQFQTASNSTSYRLIFHVASTNANAYTVNLDTVSIGPSGVTSSSSGTDVVFKRSHQTGTTVASGSDFHIPWDGTTTNIDTTNSWDSSTHKYVVPETGYYDIRIKAVLQATTDFDDGEEMNVKLYIDDVTKHVGGLWEMGSQDSSGSGLASLYAGSEISSLEYLTKGQTVHSEIFHNCGQPRTILDDAIYNLFSIAKRNSVAPTNPGATGRDVVFRVTHQTATNILHNTPTTLDWDRTRDNIDTVGGYDASQKGYIIPETGYYDIGTKITYSSSEHFNTDEWSKMHLMIDGVTTEISHILESDGDTAATLNFSNEINTIKYLTKGQLVTVQTYQNSTGTRVIEADARFNWFHVAKRNSAQAILDNETTAIQANGLSGALSMASGTPTKITLWDNYTSTHGGFDGTYYTAPSSGWYNVSGQMNIVQDSDADVHTAEFRLYIDTGSGDSEVLRNYLLMNSEVGNAVGLNQTRYLNKGDKLSFWAKQSNDDGDTLSNADSASDNLTFFSIHKVK